MMTEAPRLTNDLKELVVLASQPARLDEMMVRSLDALVESLPCDLAAVLGVSGTDLFVRCARGPEASARIREHRMSLEQHPAVRAALTEQHVRVSAGFDVEGNPYAGMLDSPGGHPCFVAPLSHGDRCIGAVVLDRGTCQPLGKETVDLALTYAHVIGLGLVAASNAGAGAQGSDEWPTLNQVQRNYIRKVLDRTRGKIYGPGGAAEILDIKPSTLQSRMQKLGVERIPSKG